MLALYCRGVHRHPEGLCEGCLALRDYARLRLSLCPFRSNKPTCAKCPVHCYKPDMREKVRAVMRYAGPRMLLKHPLLALLHLLDGQRRPRRASGAAQA